MKFYKVVLAAFIGTLIALVINFFIKVGVVSSMISTLSKDTETSTTVKPNSVLYMKLDYEIPDRTSENPFGGINFSTMESQDMTGMNEILRNIEHAKNDANIKGIYLELSSIPTSTATLQENPQQVHRIQGVGQIHCGVWGIVLAKCLLHGLHRRQDFAQSRGHD